MAARKRLVPLGAILLLALAVRLFYLIPLLRDPGFEWPDPDHYLMGARILTQEGWDWTFRAVRYEWAGRYFYLPPLYPAFLSLFAPFSNMAAAAQVGQLVLAVLSVGLVYEMGRVIHSEKAGLLASAIYALWFSSIIAAWFYQETLYVPLLLLAFVLYFRAEGHRGFALAGVAFGLAALTRSMPLYFLPFLAAVRLRRSPALLLGFAAVVLPYSAALSRHIGEPTLIENHGGIILLAEDRESGEDADVGATLTSLFRSLEGGPSAVVRNLHGSVRSVLHVNGGRLLQSYIAARDETFAVLWKIAAHLFHDLSFVLSLLLAPFGLAVARRKDASLLSAIWILLNLALVAVGGFAGPRLRAPFEPHLVVFGCIAVLEGIRALRPRQLLIAALVSLAAAGVVAPQVSRSLEGWPDYGIRWQHRPRGWRAVVRGSAGFNLRVRRSGVHVDVRARRVPGDTAGTVVEMRLSRRPVSRDVLAAGEARAFEYPWPARTVAFVELRAVSQDSGEPRELLVTTPPPRRRR